MFKRKTIITVIVLLVLFITTVFWLLNGYILTVFSDYSSSKCQIEPFTQSRYVRYGSRGELNIDTGVSVQFNYASSSVDKPYDVKSVAGIMLNFESDILDISQYDFMYIKMRLKNTSSCVISIVTSEHLSDTTSKRKKRYSERIINFNLNTRVYRLALNSFDAPEWWKARISRTKYLALPNKNPDFSKVVAIRFYHNPNTPLPNPAQLEIQRVTFCKRFNWWMSLIPAVLLIPVIVQIFIVLSYKKKKRMIDYTDSTNTTDGKGITITPSPVIIDNLDDTNCQEEKIKRLTDFINANYQDSKISVEIVARRTGIGSYEIPALLNKKYKMTFKPYLNIVRITEAKRLLKETNRTIGEIAYCVGYENIPYFNRVFKELIKMSPSEFREESDHDAEK